MVRKGVSRIDSRIGIVVEVGTSMKPSIIVGLDLGRRNPPFLCLGLWPCILAKLSNWSYLWEIGFSKGDSFTQSMTPNPYV